VSAHGTALRGRQAAERIMTDTCRIYGLGTKVMGPDGKYTTPEIEVYTGRCRVKAETGTSVGDVAAGETAVSRVTPVASVPVSVTSLKAGQRITITATSDPGLLNRTMLIRAVQTGSFITAHRLICEVI
jgi:uncharacterized protein DUF6093